eukprot:8381028-Pyramimonas_sp.AAC.1
MPHRVGRYILANQPMIATTDKALHASCFGRGWTVLPLRRVPPRTDPPRWSPWGSHVRRARAPGAAGARARVPA